MSLEVVTNGTADAGFLDSLIESYGPQTETFVVTLPKGEAFEFEAITDYSTLQTLQAGAKAFAKSTVETAWDDVGAPTTKTKALCYFLFATCKSPKLSQRDWLALAHKAAFLFEHIREQVDLHQMAFNLRADAEGVEAAKNESDATCSDETV